MVTADDRLESVLDATSYALAGAYAEGLLGAVGEDVAAEQVAAELASLVTLLDEVPGLEDLLAGAALSRRDRCAVIERVFAGRTSEPVVGLLAVLARNGRGALLRAVARRFRQILNARQGKVEVLVTTAVALDDAQRQAVRRAVRDALQAEPVLNTKVDPALLGGVVVRVGDRVYDGSIVAELNRLCRSMLAGRPAAGERREQR